MYNRAIREHVDVGSRIDGFIGHILPFCNVSYVDIRPIVTSIGKFTFVQGSIVDLPYLSDSLASLSCLHVIEHIGLGRDGDPVCPEGYIKAGEELQRVLQPGRHIFVGGSSWKTACLF